MLRYNKTWMPLLLAVCSAVLPLVLHVLQETRVISCSRRLVNEVVALQGCYAASIGGCRRFGTTSGSTLQRSGSFLGQIVI